MMSFTKKTNDGQMTWIIQRNEKLLCFKTERKTKNERFKIVGSNLNKTVVFFLNEHYFSANFLNPDSFYTFLCPIITHEPIEQFASKLGRTTEKFLDWF